MAFLILKRLPHLRIVAASNRKSGSLGSQTVSYIVHVLGAFSKIQTSGHSTHELSTLGRGHVIQVVVSVVAAAIPAQFVTEV